MAKNLHLPRIVLVTRKTPLELLLERHGTLAQAQFYLDSRGQTVAEQEEIHERFEVALSRVLSALPPDQRRVRVDRGDLDRFLFAPDDIILIVGQDGLVPNTAKYLSGQLTIGINPDADRYDGVLCRHHADAIEELLAWAMGEEGMRYRVERRVMAVAEREDGQRLLALNEVFIGHRSHQSARYRIQANGCAERHSSSGVICATGTGSTGWVRSIVTQRQINDLLPTPEQPRLAWFAREPFPSIYTGTDLDFGFVEPGQRLALVSEMGEGGTIFADGIELDNLPFLDGDRVTIGIAEKTLNLIIPADEGRAT
jgi:NAD kinase